MKIVSFGDMGIVKKECLLPAIDVIFHETLASMHL